ncbi:MAG: DUF6020 family protein [Hespellia sp.]|nr:DUF6020 family protein [Hespellia sp.]
MKKIQMKRLKEKNNILLVVIAVIFGISYETDFFIQKMRPCISIWRILLAAGVMFIVLKYLNQIDYERVLDKLNSINIKKYPQKNIWLVGTCVTFTTYMICFLAYYPGVGTNDFLNILNSPSGLANQFPVCYCALVDLVKQFGLYINHMNVAIAIFAICHMLLLSIFMGDWLEWMSKHKVPPIICLVTCGYFCLSPTIIQSSYFVTRDILWAAALISLVLISYDIIMENSISKIEIIKMIISILCVLLLRNNGMYVILPWMIIICVLGKISKKAKIIMICVVLVGILIPKYMEKDWGVEHLFKETVGIPLYQVSSVVVNNEEITEEEKEFIDSIMSSESIKANFTVGTLDPIKWNSEFHTEFLEENKIEFLSIWFKMLPKHFKTFVKSYLEITRGFWSPTPGDFSAYYTILTMENSEWLVDVVQTLNINAYNLYDEVPGMHIWGGD